MKLLKSILTIFFPLIVGGIVSLIIGGNFDYNTLVKPPLSPPGIVFPIAWTIIYLLMGISYFLYKKNGKYSEKINKTYYAQLFVNALWSIIFFALKLRFFAIIWILILDILVIYLITLFKSNYKPSAYLNIPYLLWIIFATYLTIGIFVLN